MVMKNSDGAYIQAYNAQAAVDAEHQVITAADITANPSDALNYTTMPDQSAANTGTHPKQALVDAGYCSEANLEAAKDRQLDCGTDTFMATGRLAHDEQAPPAPHGRIPKDATLKERMARTLRTKPGTTAGDPRFHWSRAWSVIHFADGTSGEWCAPSPRAGTSRAPGLGGWNWLRISRWKSGCSDSAAPFS